MTLKEYLSQPGTFPDHCGIEFTLVEEGHAIAYMTVKEAHINAVGLCHGGALFTLCDQTMAAALNSHCTVALTIQSSITYHQPAHLGETLKAEAFEAFHHHKIPAGEVRGYGEDGRLVCSMTGISYHKREQIECEGLM